jgi:hypothetical protein
VILHHDRETGRVVRISLTEADVRGRYQALVAQREAATRQLAELRELAERDGLMGTWRELEAGPPTATPTAAVQRVKILRGFQGVSHNGEVYSGGPGGCWDVPVELAKRLRRDGLVELVPGDTPTVSAPWRPGA